MTSRSQVPTAVALRRHAPTTVTPASASANEIADPFGDGSTTRSTPVTPSNDAGDRLTDPVRATLAATAGQHRAARGGVRRCVGRRPRVGVDADPRLDRDGRAWS